TPGTATRGRATLLAESRLRTWNSPRPARAAGLVLRPTAAAADRVSARAPGRAGSETSGRQAGSNPPALRRTPRTPREVLTGCAARPGSWRFLGLPLREYANDLLGFQF